MSRVVITGLGVVAPNGVGLDAFTHAIKMGFLGYGKNLERLRFFVCLRETWNFWGIIIAVFYGIRTKEL
jgi:hypothetical protein